MVTTVDAIPVEPVRNGAENDSFVLLSELIHHPDAASLYSFAISTISDATSVYWSAETKEHLEKRVDEFIERVRKYDPASSLSKVDARQHCLIEPADFGLKTLASVPSSFNELNQALDDYWNIFDEIPDSDEKILTDAPAAAEIVLNAIAEGLNAAAEKIDWLPMGDRQRIALLVWVHDPDEPEINSELAAKTNPSEVLELFGL